MKWFNDKMFLLNKYDEQYLITNIIPESIKITVWKCQQTQLWKSIIQTMFQKRWYREETKSRNYENGFKC